MFYLSGTKCTRSVRKCISRCFISLVPSILEVYASVSREVLSLWYQVYPKCTQVYPEMFYLSGTKCTRSVCKCIPRCFISLVQSVPEVYESVSRGVLSLWYQVYPMCTQVIPDIRDRMTRSVNFENCMLPPV